MCVVQQQKKSAKLKNAYNCSYKEKNK
jgi:hypothetical protein